MPFEHLIPRPLTPVAVRAFAPPSPGIYGISNAREWIYIGESDDIRGTLLGHLQAIHTPVMQRAPTGFVFELCDRAGQPARQTRLVMEYGPTCNRFSSR